MISIDITLDSQGRIYKVLTKGHAKYDDIGKDIVCSSISVLIYTLIESMDSVLGINPESYDYKISSKGAAGIRIDYSKLEVNDAHSVALVMKVFECGVLGVRKQYRKFIRLRYKEVQKC